MGCGGAESFGGSYCPPWLIITGAIFSSSSITSKVYIINSPPSPEQVVDRGRAIRPSIIFWTIRPIANSPHGLAPNTPHNYIPIE